MKISVLGPEFSYSHILASKVFPDDEFVFCSTVEDVFKKVSSDEVSKGVVPVENMLHGSVRESLTCLMKYNLKINKGFNLPIHHCLASKSNNFSRIASHPQALAQCSKFLEDYRIKGIEVCDVKSTSYAMELASKDESIAGIGSLTAAKEHGLRILKEDVEDNHDNVTRFFLISKKETKDFSSKSVRTSFMLIPKDDKPGLLFRMLAPFAVKDVNLTKIESLPSGRKLGEYIFFIEITGSMNDENVKAGVSFLKSIIDVRSFGSYELEDVSA